MSPPAATSPATDFGNASAAASSFDDFCSALLAPWWDGTGQSADATTTDAREAAARALHAALIEHKGKRGQVLILAGGRDQARECSEYLVAFLETELLKPKVKRQQGDVTELHSGVVIEISANSKRLVRDALTTIALVPPALAEAASLREIARTMLQVAHPSHIASLSKAEARKVVACVAGIEKLLGAAEGELAGFAERSHAKTVAEGAEWRAEYWSGLTPEPRAPFAGSVPQVPRQSQPHEAPLVDGVNFYSESWELWNADRKVSRDRRRAPRVLYERPR